MFDILPLIYMDGFQGLGAPFFELGSANIYAEADLVVDSLPACPGITRSGVEVEHFDGGGNNGEIAD